MNDSDPAGGPIRLRPVGPGLPGGSTSTISGHAGPCCFPLHRIVRHGKADLRHVLSLVVRPLG